MTQYEIVYTLGIMKNENDAYDENGEVVKKAKKVFLTGKPLIDLEMGEACRIENAPELPSHRLGRIHQVAIFDRDIQDMDYADPIPFGAEIRYFQRQICMETPSVQAPNLPAIHVFIRVRDRTDDVYR